MTVYRRFIRVGNRLQASPEFKRKADAEEWYHQMRRKKQLSKDGIELPVEEDDSIKFIEYTREWFKGRLKEYPLSTTNSDEQRLRVYILPFLSEIPIASITTIQIKTILKKISEPGFLGKDIPAISESTRTRVKALLSVIFTDALNEDPPLVSFNPVSNIKIKGKRKGKSTPRHLKSREDCSKFLKAAKARRPIDFLIACILLMSGIRKQELIALRWRCFNFKKRTITISEKYEQVSRSIKKGTKAGEDSSRTIPCPRVLIVVLRWYYRFHANPKFKRPDDFVISFTQGMHSSSKTISSLIERVRKDADLDISAHGLRHTYGREFAEKSGNMKALQAILGHASSSTTDLYSDLAGERVRGFGESVTFDIGVKGSEE